ncbi:hypothetical protein [Nesterenkonia halophila]
MLIRHLESAGHAGTPVDDVAASGGPWRPDSSGHQPEWRNR